MEMDKIVIKIETEEEEFELNDQTFIKGEEIVINDDDRVQEEQFSYERNKPSDEFGQTADDSGRKYGCPHCSKRFHRNPDLKKHLRVHSGEKPFTCNFCKKEFSLKHHLQVHSIIHTGLKPFQCDVCDLSFSRQSSLKRHKKFKHPQQTDPAPIEGERQPIEEVTNPTESQDPTGFEGEQQREAPILSNLDPMFSGDSEVNFSDIQDRISRSPPLNEEIKIKIEVSSEDFREEEFMHKNQNNNELKHFCPQCHEGFTRKDSLNSHLLTHTGEKPFSCDICQKSFPLKMGLTRHQVRHKRGKPFSCEICGKKFPWKRCVKLHEAVHFGIKEKLFSCGFCEKKFASVYTCKEHELRHYGDKPYSCSECDASFTKKRLLLNHEGIHSGEFTCSVCEKTFTRKHNLQRHEALVHGGERPFFCQECDKGFSDRSAFNLHLNTRVHAPKTDEQLIREKVESLEKKYGCPHCEKRFRKRQGLKQHLLVHSNEKPFPCSFCNKRFSVKNHRKSHEMTHTGEKPFECDICKMSFSRRGCLKRHKKLRHPSTLDPVTSLESREEQPQKPAGEFGYPSAI